MKVYLINYWHSIFITYNDIFGATKIQRILPLAKNRVKLFFLFRQLFIVISQFLIFGILCIHTYTTICIHMWYGWDFGQNLYHTRYFHTTVVYMCQKSVVWKNATYHSDITPLFQNPYHVRIPNCGTIRKHVTLIITGIGG